MNIYKHINIYINLERKITKKKGNILFINVQIPLFTILVYEIQMYFRISYINSLDGNYIHD